MPKILVLCKGQRWRSLANVNHAKNSIRSKSCVVFNVCYATPTSLETKQMSDYVVKDIALADFDAELDIAETEMPD